MGKNLLDFFFPITAIEPTPAASTAFLKQACLVVAPSTAEKGTPILCVSMTEVSALTANDEAQQLFDGGLNKVWILPMDDLDLEEALDGFESEFFTVLISSDFSDADILHTDAVGGVKASVKIGDITFTAKEAGEDGNDLSVVLLTGAVAGSEFAHVAGDVLTIHMSDNTSTAAQILAAFNDSVAAVALFDAAVDPGDESVAQQDAGDTPLTGGIDASSGSAGGLQLGTFKGVTGVSSDDDEFLADQAAIANRCAFHTTSGNKAQNMLYAFGKLLSNALAWRNQQYISMPLADDVDTVGAAEALFDARISFVISDDEFGERLSMFCCGGEAIAAPYVKKNLEIDLQSEALTYVSGNQPEYTHTHAALLEDQLKKVIQDYVEVKKWIEAGTVSVLLEQDNFVASGYINISKPRALWRIVGEMRQTL